MANNPQNSNRPNKPYRKRKRKPRAVNNYHPKGHSKLLSMTIEQLELKDKTTQVIKAGGVNTLYELLRYRESELYRIQNFNKRNLLEVTAKVKDLKLTFRPEENIEGPKQDRIKVYADGRIDENSGKKKRVRPNTNRRISNKAISLYDSAALVGAKLRYKPKAMLRDKLPKDALVVFFKDNKYGYRDFRGKVIIPPQYEEAFAFKDGLACVMKDDKYGYINRENEIIIPFEYDLALSFSEGFACVTKNDKSGYIDMNNQLVIDYKYDAATPFEGGNARVKLQDKWGIIDKDDKLRML